MCTFERYEYFVDRDIVNAVHAELLRSAAARACEITAYCYMPDHLHLLTTGTSHSTNALHLTTAFRQRSGFWFKSQYDQRLWQDGYFDRILRDEDATADVVSFIVANPVRAGLCARCADYPFSGSGSYRLEDLAEAVQWRPRTYVALG
jgi:putative transposase